MIFDDFHKIEELQETGVRFLSSSFQGLGQERNWGGGRAEYRTLKGQYRILNGVMGLREGEFKRRVWLELGILNVQRPTLNFQRRMGCGSEGGAGIGLFCRRMGEFQMGAAHADGETRIGADGYAGEF